MNRNLAWLIKQPEYEEWKKEIEEKIKQEEQKEQENEQLR